MKQSLYNNTDKSFYKDLHSTLSTNMRYRAMIAVSTAVSGTVHVYTNNPVRALVTEEVLSL